MSAQLYSVFDEPKICNSN